MRALYEQLLELNSLKGYSNSEQLDILKILFDTSLDKKNENGIDLGLQLCKQIDLSQLSEHQIVLYHYFVANGWATKRILKSEDISNLWNFQMEEIKNEIFHIRKAISCVGFKTISKLRQCQVYTNYGNLLNFIGRFSEAQFAWSKALEILPNSPMALGNKGKGFFHYGEHLYDNVHKKIFIVYAYKYVQSAIENFDETIVRESKEQITEFYSFLDKIIPAEVKTYDLKLDDYTLGEDDFLKKYRQWCLENYLYINPLNDIDKFSIATHDCLNLPSVKVEFDRPPLWINLFNQIKQEYGTARYLYFKSISQKEMHISDKDIVIVDTYEDIEYSYCLELNKIAFRTLYGIFDKIAFLLNDYLNLCIPHHEVHFKNIWFTNKRNGKSKRVLREFFNQSNNWALRGLYWLSKDIYEKGDEFAGVIEPDAKELDIIRNHLEHKSLKIVSRKPTSFFMYDEAKDISYSIERENFESKTLKLFKMVRSSIIYLSIAVEHEEQLKSNLKQTKSVPIMLEELQHNRKK